MQAKATLSPSEPRRLQLQANGVALSVVKQGEGPAALFCQILALSHAIGNRWF
jgi:hypothetical protein